MAVSRVRLESEIDQGFNHLRVHLHSSEVLYQVLVVLRSQQVAPGQMYPRFGDHIAVRRLLLLTLQPIQNDVEAVHIRQPALSANFQHEIMGHEARVEVRVGGDVLIVVGLHQQLMQTAETGLNQRIAAQILAVAQQAKDLLRIALEEGRRADVEVLERGVEAGRRGRVDRQEATDTCSSRRGHSDCGRSIFPLCICFRHPSYLGGLAPRSQASSVLKNSLQRVRYAVPCVMTRWDPQAQLDLASEIMPEEADNPLLLVIKLHSTHSVDLTYAYKRENDAARIQSPRQRPWDCPGSPAQLSPRAAPPLCPAAVPR